MQLNKLKMNKKNNRLKTDNNDIDNNKLLSPTSKIAKCLKEFEGTFLSKIEEKSKNANRDLNMKNNHWLLLEKRLAKTSNELDVREGQLNLAQQELEIKSIELLKQLQYKDEEIDYIKNRFQKEKNELLLDKDNLNKVIKDKNKKIEELENKLKKVSENQSSSDRKVPTTISKNNKNNEKLVKENSELKQLLLEQNKIIKQLKKQLNITEIEYYKKKEEIYLKRIEELEKFNKKLLKSSSFCKNIETMEDYKTNHKSRKEHKVFTFKTDRNFYKNKNSSNLLHEKEHIINNGNYLDDDTLILKKNEKLRKQENLK